MDDYLQYINLIKQQSINHGYYRGREVYNINNKIVNFWQDKGEYLNGLQYTTKNDFLWAWSSPEKFYNDYCNHELEFVLYSFRKFGEPKLEKPKELKGVKQAFSVDYIPKHCRCQVYVKDNDVWIKHNDYFSSTMEVDKKDLGTPLEYRVKKYLGKNKKNKMGAYPDCWGGIILRQQAWLIVKNLIYRVKIGEFESDLVNQICRQQEKVCKFDKLELCGTDMERFWGKIIHETKKNINNKFKKESII